MLSPRPVANHIILLIQKTKQRQWVRDLYSNALCFILLKQKNWEILQKYFSGDTDGSVLYSLPFLLCFQMCRTCDLLIYFAQSFQYLTCNKFCKIKPVFLIQLIVVLMLGLWICKLGSCIAILHWQSLLMRPDHLIQIRAIEKKITWFWHPWKKNVTTNSTVNNNNVLSCCYFTVALFPFHFLLRCHLMRLITEEQGRYEAAIHG